MEKNIKGVKKDNTSPLLQTSSKTGDEGYLLIVMNFKLDDIAEFLDTMRKPLKESDRELGPYPYYGASGI